MSQKLASGETRLRNVAGRQRGPHLQEPIGAGEWQRLQQHAIHHAEDRGGGANAERQHHEDGAGKQRLLAQHAHREAEVHGRSVGMFCLNPGPFYVRNGESGGFAAE
jgi:hypothetical protein